MIVGTIKLCPRYAGPNPFQKRLVTDMHFDENVWLPAIPPKMSLAHQQSDNYATLKIG